MCLPLCVFFEVRALIARTSGTNRSFRRAALRVVALPHGYRRRGVRVARVVSGIFRRRPYSTLSDLTRLYLTLFSAAAVVARPSSPSCPICPIAATRGQSPLDHRNKPVRRQQTPNLLRKLLFKEGLQRSRRRGGGSILAVCDRRTATEEGSKHPQKQFTPRRKNPLMPHSK